MGCCLCGIPILLNEFGVYLPDFDSLTCWSYSKSENLEHALNGWIYEHIPYGVEPDRNSFYSMKMCVASLVYDENV